MKEEDKQKEECISCGEPTKFFYNYISIFDEELGRVYFCSEHKLEASIRFKCLYGTGVARTN